MNSMRSMIPAAWMPSIWATVVLSVLALGPFDWAAVRAQEPEGGQAARPGQQQPEKRTFGAAAAEIQKQLDASLAELSGLRATIADEKLELSRDLRALEEELLVVRKQYEETARLVDERSFDLDQLKKEVDQRRTESNYLSNLIGQYNQGFGARLHIAELQLYGPQLEAGRLALENTALDGGERFDVQLGVVDTSIDQLEQALGGRRFDGRAVAGGMVKPGTFVLVGPTVMFRSADGLDIGAIEELQSSQEPTLIPYQKQEDRDAAAQLALGTGGSFPLDTTLGNAQKVESIKESWWEHVQKGGYIMIPMFVLAGSALLVVLLKWLSMAFVRRPKKKQIQGLLSYIDGSDYASAVELAQTLPGPAGEMLHAGAQHLGEPRELVEEVMFEKVMTARLKLQSWLPFVAICATSAPLLGLLGTVTGIMNTFSLMTEFGTGDPKTLSSGISEALITTEYGLIVAIPSLLLHAFLARKARSLVDGMEKMAMQFMNHVRTPELIDSRESVGVA